MIMGGRGLDAAWHNSGVGVEGGGEGGGMWVSLWAITL